MKHTFRCFVAAWLVALSCLPVQAQALLPGLYPGGATVQGDTTLSVAYLGEIDGDTANLTTYEYTDVPIGDANSNRRVFLLVYGRSTSGGAVSISSATIGGVSTTTHVSQVSSGFSNEVYVGVISAAVSTGTTATVSITWSAGVADMDFAVYRAVNLASATAHDTASGFGITFSSPVDLSLNVPEGGFVIAAANTNSGSHTWVGVTENFDQASAATTYSMTGALASELSAETPRTVSVSEGGFTNTAAVAASFN